MLDRLAWHRLTSLPQLVHFLRRCAVMTKYTLSVSESNVIFVLMRPMMAIFRYEYGMDAIGRDSERQ